MEFSWWRKVAKINEYHRRQYFEPYESTLFLFDIISDLSHSGAIKTEDSYLLDFGSGGGAVTRKLAQQFPKNRIIGVEKAPELIAFAIRQNIDCKNIDFVKGNFLRIKWPKKVHPTLLTCIQTISWVESRDIYAPLESLFRHNAKVVIASFLAYDGLVDCKITINDFSDSPWRSPYNILSHAEVERIALANGYIIKAMYNFEPKAALVSKNPKGMGSYTESLSNGKLLTFSGPLHLPWKYYVFERNISRL